MREKEIKIILNYLPPSVNEAYSGYRVRHKSKAYLDFLRNLEAWFLQAEKNYKISGDSWLAVDYTFYFPLYFKNWKIRKRDLWNFEKVLTDWLSHFIPWFDDEKIKVINLRKNDCEKWEEKTIIRIYEIL